MQIGKRNIRIEPSEFKSKLYISIREWYQPNPEEEKMLPGKKGISLNLEEWNEIVENFDDIKSEIARAQSSIE